MVREEVQTKLDNFAAMKQIPVAYEAVPFTVPVNGEWLEIYFLEPSLINSDLAATKVREYGSFRINVYSKLGEGAGKVLGLAREVAALFPVLPKVGVTSVESPPVVGRVLPDDDSVFVPVTVRYRAEY